MKLACLAHGLSKKEYRKLRSALELDPCKEHRDNMLDRTVQVFRGASASSQQEMLELTGCTPGTYRSYKSHIVDALLSVIATAHRDGIQRWLRDIEKAWVLTELGEHRLAYDLADTVREQSLKHERGTVARLALEVMSSTVQEAYPDSAVTKLTGISEEMFSIAGQFFSMTGLYRLYTSVGSRTGRTLLLRTPEEHAEWEAWKESAAAYGQKQGLPLSHWAYLALSECSIHELKGDMDGAFGWYERLWEKMTGDQQIIDLGDKRFLTTFHGYILLAIKTGKAQKARKANDLFGNAISDHHSSEVQQRAIHRFFDLRIRVLVPGHGAIRDGLRAFISDMRKAKKQTAYCHRDWSPHVRHEIYMGLFNLCFELKWLDGCRLILKWGNDRRVGTETASDLTQIIPLLIAVVCIEENRKDGALQPGLHDSTAEAAYDRFRRKRETFPVETEIARFLHGLGHARPETFPALKAECLQSLAELKEDCFYYRNLMRYFNFEKWVGSLEV